MIKTFIIIFLEFLGKDRPFNFVLSKSGRFKSKTVDVYLKKEDSTLKWKVQALILYEYSKRCNIFWYTNNVSVYLSIYLSIYNISKKFRLKRARYFGVLLLWGLANVFSIHDIRLCLDFAQSRPQTGGLSKKTFLKTFWNFIIQKLKLFLRLKRCIFWI